MQMIPQGGIRPPPGGSLHSLATEKFEFRVIALERDFFDFLEIGQNRRPDFEREICGGEVCGG